METAWGLVRASCVPYHCAMASKKRRSESVRFGPLERSVMEVLWSVDGALTPAQVQQRLEGSPAYTTVMTVLVRLCSKGAVTRKKVGRAFTYRPVTAEAELDALRLQEVLDGSSDRVATMSRFVEGLGPGEADALRAALEELER